MYGNEEDVGEAIRQSGVNREEVFVSEYCGSMREYQWLMILCSEQGSVWGIQKRAICGRHIFETAGIW